MMAELWIVVVSLEKQRDLDTTLRRPGKGGTNLRTRKCCVASEEDLALRLGNQVGQHGEGQPAAGPFRLRARPNRGDDRLFGETLQVRGKRSGDIRPYSHFGKPQGLLDCST